MIYVTRRVSFSASHRLFNPNFSDEKNFEIFDKCNNPNGHGHNYILEVTVAGEPNPETGYVFDLKKLKKIIKENILNEIDHKHFNLDVDFMKGIIPTAENIAVLLFRKLLPHINEGKLYKIKIYETENNFVEYFGDDVNIPVYNNLKEI